MVTRLALGIAVLAILSVSDRMAMGQEQKPVVSLLLSKATVERLGHDILFRCEAVLENALGKDIAARSNFSSVFDGLELVVTTSDGKILAQQHYTYHQSPQSEADTYTLKPGRTSKTLNFPIRDLPAEVKTLKVRLVGTLPKSDYKRILSSETLDIQLK